MYDTGDSTVYLDKAVALEQEKIKKLDELPPRISFLLNDAVSYEDEAMGKWFSSQESHELLKELSGLFKSLEDSSPRSVEEAVRSFAKKKGIKTASVFHPLRVAVSGRTQGPSLFEMLSLIGRERVIKRLAHCLAVAGGIV